MCTSALSLLILSATAVWTSEARSILTFPTEIRKRNYVRLSTEKCDECVTMEDFYAQNPLGFILFYERALMGHHKYKAAIVTGWMETCEELRWSRIACGMVDMLSDRAYAERYIDPTTAPAHIVVSNGQPVPASKEQINDLMAKPGHKATMISHVMDMLKESSPGNLTLSVQVNSKEAMERLLKKHHLVVAAFTGDERHLADAFRASAQEAVLVHSMAAAKPTDGSNEEKDADSGRKGKGSLQAHQARVDKYRIAWAAVTDKRLGSHFGLADSDRSIAAFVHGKLRPGAVPINPKAKPGDADMLENIKKVIGQARWNLPESLGPDAFKKVSDMMATAGTGPDAFERVNAVLAEVAKKAKEKEEKESPAAKDPEKSKKNRRKGKKEKTDL